MSHCEICGERLAGSLDGYRAHLKRFHHAQPSQAITDAFARHEASLKKGLIRPIKLTTRSKAQIVHDTEKTWGYALTPMVRPWDALGDC